MKVLMIDNYDSFTYNLVQYLEVCGAKVHTARHDALTLEGVRALSPDRIVISPGPGNPGKDLGCIGVGAEVLRELEAVPVLGVCLGCQAIGARFGARVRPARRLMHGKASTISHDGRGVFAGLPSPLRVARYHSLALERSSVRAPLAVTALSEDGEVMGVRHERWPIEGVQFHPESILTQEGMRMIQNFLDLSGAT